MTFIKLLAKEIEDMVTGGRVFASGAQPPASVTKKIPFAFGVKFYCFRQRDGQTESGMEAANFLKIYQWNLIFFCYWRGMPPARNE